MEAREASQLLTKLRISINDRTERYRWSDAFLLRALTNAEREAAYRARLLRDDSQDFCQITLVDDTAEYTLDNRIFDLDIVRLETDGKYLQRKKLDELLQLSPLWRTHTASVPRFYMLERTVGGILRLTVYPKPNELVDDVLLLTAWRYPLEALEGASDEPEIDPDLHDKLIDWAAYEAYMDRAPDKYDPIRARDHLATFEANFGLRDSAYARAQKMDIQRYQTRPRRL